jgi:hypothetical protein
MSRMRLEKERFFRSQVILASLASVILLVPLERAAANDAGNPEGKNTVWSIGKTDGSSIEFAIGEREKLAYTVGASVPEKDFSARQLGSVSLDPQVPSREYPYTIAFDLAEPPSGRYELILDLVFPTAAPDQIKVEINGRKGIFPVLPVPKEDIDSDDANSMLLAKQRIVVPVGASVLKPKGNSVTLVPLGVGALNYDALGLERVPGSISRLPNPQIVPTIFYRKDATGLKEVCRLLVPFDKRFRKGNATIRLGATSVVKPLTSGDYDFGILLDSFEIPALMRPVEATIRVSLDGRSQQARQQLIPAKQWKVFICPKVHNDVGYTDVQPHVNELDTRNTDTILDILDRWPFYKFNIETAWLVDNYLASRPARYHQRLFNRLAEGRAAVNAFYLNLMTGLCTGEELYRAMYYTYGLHKKKSGNFDYACLTDAPSHSWFLPSLLTDVGIGVFSNGSNQTRAPILQFSDLNENSPYYWEGLNGERIMMWYARSYSQLKRLTNPNLLVPISSYDYLQSAVPQFLARFMREDYVPDAVMIYGAYVDNAAVPETGEAHLIAKWNEEYEYPKLVVATDAEYFSYIDKRFADRLRVYRGDAGAYWEDGAGSTMHATKANRHSQQLLPAVETLASFASLFDPRNRYPAEDLRAAWNLVFFYDEHTWGAHSSISQPDREFVKRQWEIKESYALRANLDARSLLTRNLNRFFQQVTVGGDTVFAVNLQNWMRTAPVEVELNSGQYLVDLSTNQPVALDVLTEKDGWRRVRFMAENVPSVGYKGFGLRSLGQPRAPEQAPAKDQNNMIENQFYRLEVDSRTGGIKSLYDKANDRELADPSAPYTLNQYLYVSGGSDTLIIDNIYGRPLPQLVLHSPESARIVENVQTPFSQRIVVEMSATNTPTLRSEYVLYNQVKRIDITNTFEKTATREKEAVYFAFPFAARNPGLEYQIQNGWVRPNEDQLPGACREWFTTQNLVHVKDGDFSIAWATPDAPLITLVDINRGKWPRHLEIKNGHVFSYALNNYWFTNYKAAQGGEFSFRFAMSSDHRVSREQLARFDADTRTPVFVYPLLSSFSASVETKNRLLPAAAGSLMALEAPNLQMVALKAAEDGDGYVLRLQETAGRSGNAEVVFPGLDIREAYLSNGVEEPQRKLATTSHTITVPYEPNRYITIRLKAEASAVR